MARAKKRSEPTGIELFLYWWELTHEGVLPQKHFQLSLYDEQFRQWLNGWKPRQTFFNVCRQAARRSVGSLITPSSVPHIRVWGDDNLCLTPDGTLLVEHWLNSLPRNDKSPVAPLPTVKHTKKCDEERTVHQPTVKHPIGTDEMIGVVAENYRRRMPVSSFTEGFRAGAEWVLGMDPVTLSYLRGELDDGKA